MAEEQALQITIGADGATAEAAIARAIEYLRGMQTQLSATASSAQEAGTMHEAAAQKVAAASGQAATAVTSEAGAVERLVPALGTATAAIEALTASLAQSTAAHAAHAGAVTLEGAAIGKVETVANSMARAFASAGVESEALTSRVFALGGAFDALSKAALPIAAISAAMLTLGAAFAFVKDSIQDFADLQRSLDTIKGAVDANKGSWSDAKASIDAFLESLVASTTYTRTEGAEALSRLVTAGKSVEQAERETALAAEIARGAHISLHDAIEKLINLEAGRPTLLARIDVNVKDLVKDHGELSKIVDKVHQQYRDQLPDINAYDQASQHLTTSINNLKEATGAFWTALATAFKTALADMLDRLNQGITAFGDFWTAVGALARDGANVITASFEAVAGAISRNAGQVADGLAKMNAAWSAIGADAGRRVSDAWNAATRLWEAEAGVAAARVGGAAGDAAAASFDSHYAARAAKGEHGRAGISTSQEATKAEQEQAKAIRQTTSELEEQYKAGKITYAAAVAGLMMLQSQYKLTRTEQDELTKAYDTLARAEEAAARRGSRAGAVAERKAEAAAARDQAMSIREIITNLQSEYSQGGITYAAAIDGLSNIVQHYKLTRQEADEVNAAVDRFSKDEARRNEQLAKTYEETQKRIAEAHKRSLEQQFADLAKVDADKVRHNAMSFDEMMAKLAEWVSKHAEADRTILNDFRAFADAQTKLAFDELVKSDEQLVAHHHLTYDQMAADLQAWVALHRVTDTEILSHFSQTMDDTEKKAAEQFVQDTDRLEKLKLITEATAKAELEVELAKYQAMGDAGLAAAKVIQDAIDKLSEHQIAEAQKVADEQEKQIQKVVDKWNTVLSDLIFDHKKVASDLKSIWKDFIDSWLKQVETAFLTSGIFGGVFGTGGSTSTPSTPGAPGGPGTIPSPGPAGGLFGWIASIFGGGGAGGATGGNPSQNLTQAVTKLTTPTDALANTEFPSLDRDVVALDADIRTLTTAVQSNTQAVQGASGGGQGGAGAAGFGPGGITLGQIGATGFPLPGAPNTGAPASAGVVSSWQNALTEAAAIGAITFGLLGAFLGSSGASQVISLFPSTSSPSGGQPGPGGIYAPNAPIEPPAAASQFDFPILPGGYPAGTMWEPGLVSGMKWQIYNIYVGSSAIGSASYPTAGGSSFGDVMSGGGMGASAFGMGVQAGLGGGVGSGTIGGPGSIFSQIGTILGAGPRGGGGGGGGGSPFPGGMGGLNSLGRFGQAANAGFQGMAEGYVIGSLLSGLFKGQNDAAIGGSIGGAIGGFAGSLIGGPLGGIVGGLAGSVLGSLVGGLFGSHDVPANMPDKYDTQRFGTIIADLQGQMGANGQTFYEESSVSQITGGLTGIAFVEMVLAKYGSKTNAPPWLVPYWDKLTSMFGVSATGAGKLVFEHDIDKMHIEGASGAGGIFSYLDYGQALYTFLQAFQTNVGDVPPTASTYNLNRAGGNMNIATDQYTGQYNPFFGSGTSGGSAPTGGGGGATGYGNIVGGGGGLTSYGPGGGFLGGGGTVGHGMVSGGGSVILVDLRGSTIVGPNGLNQVAISIGQALQRVAQGQVGGSPQVLGSSPALRFMGDF